MSNEEKYTYIMNELIPNIPKEITGKRRVNIKSNIRGYLKQKLNLTTKKLKPVVHLSVIKKIDSLLVKLN